MVFQTKQVENVYVALNSDVQVSLLVFYRLQELKVE